MRDPTKICSVGAPAPQRPTQRAQLGQWLRHLGIDQVSGLLHNPIAGILVLFPELSNNPPICSPGKIRGPPALSLAGGGEQATDIYQQRSPPWPAACDPNLGCGREPRVLDFGDFQVPDEESGFGGARRWTTENQRNPAGS